MKTLLGGAIALAAFWIAIVAAVPHATYRHDGPALLNDLSVTPGDVRTTEVHEICDAGKTTQWRHTTPKMKDQVCLEYGLKPHCYGADTNEIDHLISIEIGGADTTKNLWPQPYFQHPGAHEKDLVENYLHRQVCSGKLTPTQAQKEIATDWYAVYKAMPK